MYFLPINLRILTLKHFPFSLSQNSAESTPCILAFPCQNSAHFIIFNLYHKSSFNFQGDAFRDFSHQFEQLITSNFSISIKQFRRVRWMADAIYRSAELHSFFFVSRDCLMLIHVLRDISFCLCHLTTCRHQWALDFFCVCVIIGTL